MKQFMLSICLLCACTTLQAQGRKHTTFFDQRATLFEALPTSKKDIIFLGNSITNGGEWAELLGNPHVKNRGISGDRADTMLDRLHVITKGKPAKIFLLIGINDLAGGRSVEDIAKDIDEIAERIKNESPSTPSLSAERSAAEPKVQHVCYPHEPQEGCSCPQCPDQGHRQPPWLDLHRPLL